MTEGTFDSTDRRRPVRRRPGAGSQFFFATTGSKDKTLKLYQDHFHDLFADIGREQVMRDLVEWLDSRT